MLRTHSYPALLASGVFSMLLAAPAIAAPINIINGDFELDGADDVAPPSGWTDLSVADAGGLPPGFYTGIIDESGNPTLDEAATAPAPGLGDYILTTARTSAGAIDQPTDGILVQTVDISSFAALIDNGDQALDLSFIYASDDQRDTGSFSTHFFASTDGSGAELGTGYSVALDADNGYEFTGWLEESVYGQIPSGARSVTLQIDTTRTGGSETNIWIDNITGDIDTYVPPPPVLLGDINNDGFVGLDDLDIVLNEWNMGTPPTPAGSPSIPEPASLALLGVSGIAILRSRK